MKRTPLIHLLQAYSPAHSEEKIFQTEMMNFIERQENCFERFLETGHITASSWLLSKDHTKALLMHHTKLDRWVQLGGHCDGDPDVMRVAIKEAREESGIGQIRPVSNEIFDIDIHLIPAKDQICAHYHYDVRFLLETTSEELVVSNRESKELRWVGKNIRELPTDSRSVVRMFIKWLDP